MHFFRNIFISILFLIGFNFSDILSSQFPHYYLKFSRKFGHEKLLKDAQLCIDNAPEKKEILEKLGIDEKEFDEKFDKYFKERNILYLGYSGLGELHTRSKFLFYIAIAEILKIKELVLSGNKLTTLPEEIFNLKSLEVLNLSDNKLTKLSPKIIKLRNLEVLDLSKNRLKSLPSKIFGIKIFKNLIYDFNLDLDDPPGPAFLSSKNKFVNYLTNNVLGLDQLIYLNLSDNQFTKLPSQIGKLTNLKTLILSHNKLTKLPKQISNLKELGCLDLSFNLFIYVPTYINKLTKLTWLNLNFNPIKELSKEIQGKIDEYVKNGVLAALDLNFNGA
ncbi:MAG: leucine-rich repeat domain-containing protein [Candidatus Babeliales bacterium]